MMKLYLFYNIIGMLIGILSGYFIFSIKQQKWLIKQKSELISQEQILKILKQDLTNEFDARQNSEQKLRDNENIMRELYGKLIAAEERLVLLDHFRQEYEQCNKELCNQREINIKQATELKEVTIRLEETKLATEEKQRLLINSEQRLSIQFENLANRIFEQNGHKIDKQNCQSIEKVILPLREQLDGFRRQIQDNYSQEACERHTLVHELRNLQKLNIQMTQESINLTQALKGNNKIQGNWGEIVLSRILESSGLREGHEFQTQINIKGDNIRLQPDVVVRLPNDRNIIIDSKLSLVAYERYFNSSSENDRKNAFNEHINSIKTHIKLLSKKDYQQSFNLQTLDYVLMFIPIEPAFMIAIDKHPELINEASTYNIMLVSPTTLFVALRTINNLWRYEHQNNNAQHIADLATRLYDKLRLFIDNMNSLEQSLEKAQSVYYLAKNKLSEGRNNIIDQAEAFRSLGVEIRRPIVQMTTTISSKEFIIKKSNNKDHFSKHEDTEIDSYDT